MALIKCKKCDFRGTVGVMPNTSCGIIVIGGGVVGVMTGLGIVNPIIHELAQWIKIVVWIVVVPIMGFVGMILIHLIPWSVEWLLAMCHRCPECGSRKWSFPFTEGFGL